jgi:hypothetical protein
MDPTLFQLFELIDASGGGCCRLGVDQTIATASRNFLALTGASEVSGRPPAELLGELPPLAELPAVIGATPVIVRVVGADGVGRELAIARVADATGETGGILLLGDRSGEAKAHRNEARLERQLDDLRAELVARERQPGRPPIRTMVDLMARLNEALMRAVRYKHDVTVAAVRVTEGRGDRTVGEAILGCVRGVDDLGHAGDDHWILVLPHTGLAGGEIVGKRVVAKLGALEIGPVAIGVAQIGPAEPSAAGIRRADLVCNQALENGGGVLLAVALT